MKKLFEGQTSLSIVNADDFWGRKLVNTGIILLNDRAMQDICRNNRRQREVTS